VSVPAVRCEVEGANRLFYETDTVQLNAPSDIPRAADVVFVIQHATCNAELMSKIPGLVDSLDKAMRAQHLPSLRYAVVGFGGRQTHLSDAHIHTMDGQVFNSANKVAVTVNFKFYSRLVRQRKAVLCARRIIFST